jgi:hypothetical protein
VAVQVALLLALVLRRREVEGQAAFPHLAEVGALLQRLGPLHLRPLPVLPLGASAHAVSEVVELGVL